MPEGFSEKKRGNPASKKVLNSRKFGGDEGSVI